MAQKNAKGYFVNEFGKDSGEKTVDGVQLFWNRRLGEWQNIQQVDARISALDAAALAKSKARKAARS